MILSYGLQQNVSVKLHMMQMLKQFILQLSKAATAVS